jgi:hypothetical protein
MKRFELVLLRTVCIVKGGPIRKVLCSMLSDGDIRTAFRQLNWGVAGLLLTGEGG